MTRYVLRLFVASGRWVAPALAWSAYCLVGLSGVSGDPTADAVALLPGSVLAASWLFFNAFTFDGRGHRDYLAAAAGSAFADRMHRVAAAALIMLVGIALLAGSQVIVAGAQAGPIMLMCLVPAVLLGASAASLAPPLVHDRTLARLLVVGLAIALIMVPVAAGWLRSISRGSNAAVVGVLLWALACCGGAHLVLRWLLPRRALSDAS